MPNAKNRAADKIKRNLFLPKKDITDELSEAEYERKKRIMLTVTYILDDPGIPDKEIVKYLTTGCDGTCIAISSSQAYRDLRLINNITGNIKRSSKEWNRYMVIETSKKWARAAAEKGDFKSAAAHNKNIIIVDQLDKDDKENIFDQMIPFEPEITHDPSVLGEDVELIDNVDQRRAELRQLFRKRTTEDAEIIEGSEETI